jgi:uncharacterized protein (TIGR02246 family)
MPLSTDDHLAILDLAARYNHAIDGGDPQAWADTFTADGVFVSTRSGRHAGREALVAFAEDFARTRKGIRHWVNNLVVEGDSATGRASLRCYLLLWDTNQSPPAVVGAADYEDDLVRVDGAWRFARRQVG